MREILDWMEWWGEEFVQILSPIIADLPTRDVVEVSPKFKQFRAGFDGLVSRLGEKLRDKEWRGIQGEGRRAEVGRKRQEREGGGRKSEGKDGKWNVEGGRESEESDSLVELEAVTVLPCLEVGEGWKAEVAIGETPVPCDECETVPTTVPTEEERGDVGVTLEEFDCLLGSLPGTPRIELDQSGSRGGELPRKKGWRGVIRRGLIVLLILGGVAGAAALLAALRVGWLNTW